MFISPVVLVLAILTAGAAGAALTTIAFWIRHMGERLDRLERRIRSQADCSIDSET